MISSRDKCEHGPNTRFVYMYCRVETRTYDTTILFRSESPLYRLRQAKARTLEMQISTSIVELYRYAFQDTRIHK